MIRQESGKVKASRYDGSDPSKQVFCAQGHPMTATSALAADDGCSIGLAGGLSHQRSRLMPYTIRRCKHHRARDAQDVNASNYRPCPDCMLVNAHGEPLVSLEFALTFHEKYEDRARDLRHLARGPGAVPFPGGPLRDHLEFCDAIDDDASRAQYAPFWPECRPLMQLMAEFAGRLFVREAPSGREHSEGVSKSPRACDEESAWFYNTDMCARRALVESIEALRKAGVPGFGKAEFKEFDPRTFHKSTWLQTDPDMEWETVDPRHEARERHWRRFFRTEPIQHFDRPLLRYYDDVADEELYDC